MENAQKMLEVNKAGWERSAERFFGRTALPEYGPHAYREDQLQLFDSIEGKKVLDIGCGSGHSLHYMALQGAEELWGLDLSDKQIKTSHEVLKEQKVHQLFVSPMEENPGLPTNYFDIVYSIYALGWTVDLKQTLSNIFTYLKPNGTLIFSWEHPMHDRVTYKEGNYILHKSYLEEGPEWNEAWPDRVITHHIKLSTYVNTLIECGFRIEKILDDVNIPEESNVGDPNKWYATQKAALLPATFIVNARKG